MSVNGTAGFSPGRRKLLIGGTATVVMLSYVGAASWGRVKGYRAAWVEQVVRSNLPGIELDAESMKTFVDYMLTVDRMWSAAVKAVVFSDRFIPWLPAHVTKVRDGLEGLERHVLTEYLIGSNFFRVEDPKRETIAYGGHFIACGNPFMYG